LSALRDANQWRDKEPKITLQDVDIPAGERRDGGLYLYECSWGVYDRVMREGGQIDYEEKTKTYLCLPEELEATKSVDKDIEKIRLAYLCEPDADILYQFKKTDGRWTGWRSFHKSAKKEYLPWPWEMIGAPGVASVEWKLVDRRV